MRILLLVLALLTPVIANAAGNGSGGIGNKYALPLGLASRLPANNYISIIGNKVVDGKTGEALLEIKQEGMAKPKIQSREGELVNAHLGTITGFEFVPSTRALVPESYWIVCPTPGNCVRLTPLSKTNPKATAVIGGLTK